MRRTLHSWKGLPLWLLFLALPMRAAEAWNATPFTADATSVRQAADAVKAEKHSAATVLLNDVRFAFDNAGRLTQTRHLIYRIENQQGVEGWAETSGRWEAWHEAKPEIKARVITAEGTVQWLDPKTLSDVPVHEDAPDLYSDERKFGGPLPALAPGAIVEEQVIVRETAPLFSGGIVHRWDLAWSVPAHQTQIVISYPESLPLHYQAHRLPDAEVTKSHENGAETVTIEQGPLSAYTEETDNVPADVVLYPEVEFSTGTSWQQVAAEYARVSGEKLRTSDAQPLIAKINLKAGGRNDVIRRLVDALHKNVRYTGVEFGESSLIPQLPSETLKRKYGDCKDKAALLVTMLRAAGIAADLALLDAGPGRDINTDLPGMGMFDHAIVYVPASASDPELWIDATAQYSQVGTLPWMDYGRWVLVVDTATEALKKIPELTAAQNVNRELREFTLAEYGPAAITETDDEIGPQEADYRDYYSGDSKEIHKNSESYVKDVYLADSLTALDHGDLSDLDKSASIKFVTKGRRGNTDLTSAIMAIRVENLFERFPGYFKTKEKDDDKTSEDDADKPRSRTADWWITPFTTEWRYKITAPLGFKLRALPSDRAASFGGVSFTQKYSANSDGSVVEALLRVESTSTRMTVDQAKDLRDAVLKARNSDPIFISFDHVGETLIAAGKFKEGLAAYRDISAQHPKEALHKVQLAQALLKAGLGEDARSAAQEAATLEPGSALAFTTLGNVLKNDLIGRPIKKGMDYEGAVSAYRKALTLDPKDKECRTNLGLLLEYDAEGTRYSEKARLKDAVAEFRELKKVDEDYARNYDDNILYDLWYAHDVQGVLDYAAALPTSEARKGLTLAAIAAQQGTEAALNKSLEITTDEQSRAAALVTAGAVLIRVRRYEEGAAMLSAGAHGRSNESDVQRSAAVFSKTRPYEQVQLSAADPRGVVQQLFGDMISGKLTLDGLKALTDSPEDESPEPKEFQRMMSKLKGEMGAEGLPLVVVADIAVSNMHFSVDGDDSLGYKVTVETPGAAAQDIYVVKAGDRYKVAAFSRSGESDIEALAPLALRAIDQNNLAAARKWLDRARDKIRMSGGEDPLDGSPFPYFWTKGQEADAATMRTAALVLLPSKELKGAYLTALDQVRGSAKTDIERARLSVVVADAYSAQDRSAEMSPLVEELLKSFPGSLRAFYLATAEYAGLKRYDEWEKLVQGRIRLQPDELAYVRSSSSLAMLRGDIVKSRAILKTLIDKGQATTNDLNSYAWFALLLPHPIAQDDIDDAQRASDLTKNDSFAILHTLACLDAQAGKTSPARDLLLRAMKALNLEEPNEEIWFGFGLIAEQYGDFAAARRMYGRIEKPKLGFDSPSSTYSIAQSHMAAMR